ncbi:ABC transporter ATP-binding protein [Streptomyces olivoverticillatus]
MRTAIEDLDVALSGRTVVSGVRIMAEEGEIAGLVGPNGSGKSTVLRTVYRHLRPHAGRVLVGGADIRALTAVQSARQVAALPQERGTDFELSVREVVAMGRTPYKRAFAGEDPTDGDAVAAALDQVGMAGGGAAAVLRAVRRRAPARAAGPGARPGPEGAGAGRADEPSGRAPPGGAAGPVAPRHRRTTLLAIHDLNAAASVCDRLHVLHGGKVVASGTPREVLTAGLLAEVFGVRAAVVDHPLTGDPLIAFDHRAPVFPVSGR